MVTAEEELDAIDIDGIGNLVDLPRLMFINEKCRDLKVVVDSGWFTRNNNRKRKSRSSYPEVSLVKGVLKICSKFTGEHSCRSMISMQLYLSRTSAYVFSCCIFSEHYFSRRPLEGCFCC